MKYFCALCHFTKWKIKNFESYLVVTGAANWYMTFPWKLILAPSFIVFLQLNLKSISSILMNLFINIFFAKIYSIFSSCKIFWVNILKVLYLHPYFNPEKLYMRIPFLIDILHDFWQLLNYHMLDLRQGSWFLLDMFVKLTTYTLREFQKCKNDIDILTN